MKKAKIFLGIGFLMIIAAVKFVFFALNHPEMYFPWSNGVTYAIYAVYLIVMIVMFVLFVKAKNK